ncbi:gap junction alpha-3 protein-like [Fundulus heteroclitus]|uniref:gap junction alpha-3 protein-like n=1 Tax=Fundulus heteroclitus TaxID=8078 RepID=UPI00165BBFBB|nr:gap junction alpha-3 protein-like [Fundulus heteroclitus]
MGEFGELSNLLKKAKKKSTTVGKVWLTVLFVFRIFVLVIAAKEVWGDEQSNFLCDTKQPGCQLACYDNTFPVSHLRFWIMQILIVSTPTLIYLGFLIHQEGKNKKEEDRKVEVLLKGDDLKNIVYDINSFNRKRKNGDPSKEDTKVEVLWEDGVLKTKVNTIVDQPSKKDNNGKVPSKGRARTIYVLNIVFTILFEVAFLVAQYYLYGFGLELMYPCERWPCLTKVFCYVSRPTEKTIFIIFMLIVALVSLLLNVVEMFFVFCKKKKEANCESNNAQTQVTVTVRQHYSKRHSGTYI